MTRLPILRQQLAMLRRTRQTVRLATAYCALASAVLWLLAGIFVLDVIFELTVLQRLLVMAAAAGGAVWAYSFFTSPLLGVKESNLEIALLVERQQQIDSDLVAALQFESPQASQWGSQQLEEAVIDYVAQLGGGLNVLEGFSRAQMGRRLTVLLATVGVLIALAFPFGRYYSIFLNRLFLGSQHYPTDTIIDQVAINHHLVLTGGPDQQTRPNKTSAAQGQPVSFLVLCRGETPESGLAKLTGLSSGTRRDVVLEKLSTAQRRQRLIEAQQMLKSALRTGDGDASGAWGRRLESLIRFDAPLAQEQFEKARQDADALPQVEAEIAKVLADWPSEAVRQSDLYLGVLPNLADQLQYTLRLGDAWTDEARIAMIPLPVVETDLSVKAPAYAAAGKPIKIDPGARQISVLEGSRVDLSIRCANQKRLTKAWLTSRSGDENRRFELDKQDDAGLTWKLKVDETPFANVSQEIRYQIQVLDEDGLMLETPIRGYVRIRPDRLPTVVASALYRAVTPKGKPSLQVRLTDDYGIARLAARIEFTPSDDTTDRIDELSEKVLEIDSLRVGSAGDTRVAFPLQYGQLPMRGAFTLSLSNYPLVKGDRVKITLLATDHRGELPGQTGESQPIVLEVTDEAGILAAMSEIDGQSDKQLTDIEKRQKQILGIGDSP